MRPQRQLHASRWFARRVQRASTKYFDQRRFITLYIASRRVYADLASGNPSMNGGQHEEINVNQEVEDGQQSGNRNGRHQQR